MYVYLEKAKTLVSKESYIKLDSSSCDSSMCDSVEMILPLDVNNLGMLCNSDPSLNICSIMGKYAVFESFDKTH